MNGQDDLSKRLENLDIYTSDLEKYLVSVRSEIADLKKKIIPIPPPDVEESERQAPVDTIHADPPLLIAEAAFKPSDDGASLAPNKFNSEAALRNTGAALFLLGVAFFFKYAIEHSLITPILRVAIGFITGVAMLNAGLYTHSYKRRFAQVMLGGGVATLYIAIFAGYNSYAMFSHPVSLASMTGVTILAFALAMRKGERVVALVAAAGGLMTPFVLPADSANIAGLVGYILFVFAVSSSIYFFKGWRPLLAVSSYGGWGAMAIANVHTYGHGDPEMSDQVALQAGVVFLWIGCWLLPNAREAVAVWKETILGRWALKHMEDVLETPSLELASSYAISSSVFLVLFIAPIWRKVDDWQWGLIFLGIAAAKGIVGWLIRGEGGLSPLVTTHKTLAITSVSLAIWSGLDNDWRTGAFVVEGLILIYLYLKYDDRIYEKASYAIFAISAIEFVDVSSKATRLAEGQWPFVNLSSLFNLCLFAAWIYASMKYRDQKAREVFWVFIHLLFLYWLWVELSVYPNGEAYTSLAWGTLGIGALVIGLMTGQKFLFFRGSITLLVMVAKLLAVDMQTVSPLWKILLFTGFGATFLGVSYLYKKLAARSSFTE